MNPEIKNILVLRYICAGLFGIITGIETPSILKLQGISFSSSEIAILMVILSIIGCFQFLCNRLNQKTTLYIPIWIAIIVIILEFMYLFNDIRMFIIIHVIGDSILALLFYNRSMVITEILKKHYQISQFSNKQLTLLKLGGLSGYVISVLLLKVFKLSNEIVICIAMIICILAVPVLIILNGKVLEFQNRFKNGGDAMS